MLRTLDRPTGVHESFRSSLSLGPLSWSPPTAIPGRLADPGLLGGQDQTARKPTPLALPLPRDSHKRAEVRPIPVQVCGLLRHDHRHDLHPSLAHRSSDTKIPHCSKEFLVTTEPPSTAVAGVVGTRVIAGEVGYPGKTPGALTPVASKVQLVHRERSPTPHGTPVPAGGQGHLLVDGDEPPRGDDLRGKPPPPPVLRLYSVGVGSPPPRSVSVGTMVEAGDIATRQHLGDESPVPSTLGFSGHDHQPASDRHVTMSYNERGASKTC